MAKRRHAGEAELPFVALMDTMTNVVGVLIIVLVMIGISLAAAVHKVLSDLPPSSPAQVSEVQAALNKLRAALKSSKAKAASLEKSTSPAAQIEKEILQVESTIKAKNIKVFDIASLRKELTARELNLAHEQASFDRIAAERDKLKALLDSTPIPKPPAPTMVKIPLSREVPPSAEIIYCFVKKDQIFLVAPPVIESLLMRDFNLERDKLVHQVIRKANERDKFVYDQNKVTKFFSEKDYTVRGQKVNVPLNPTRTFLLVTIQIGTEPDATASDLDQPNGRFHGLMTAVRKMPRAVLIFKVATDGFDTYLKAREIADAFNVPCGWEIDGGNSVQKSLPIYVKQLVAPPPPPPNTPKPPQAPKGPKRTLD